MLAKKHVFFAQTLKYCFTNKEFIKSKAKIYNIKKMITQQFTKGGSDDDNNTSSLIVVLEFK